MQDGRRGRLPHRIEARADLVTYGEFVDGVEPPAIVDGQIRCNVPLVLQPAAEGPTGPGYAGKDLARERSCRGAAESRVAELVGTVLHQHRRDGLGGEPFAYCQKAATERVVRGDLADDIDLHAVGEALEQGVLRDAIEGDVGERRVAPEMESAVFGESRDPKIDGHTGMQIGQNPELARFVLPLVELRRVERGDGDAVQEVYPREGRRGRIVRDLEPAVE